MWSMSDKKIDDISSKSSFTPIRSLAGQVPSSIQSSQIPPVNVPSSGGPPPSNSQFHDWGALDRNRLPFRAPPHQ